jgi:HEAT repeat protein
MTGTESPLPDEAGSDHEESERTGTPFLVLQFFVFPMAIVAVCVAVFVIFGLIAGEQKGAWDYLREVRTGGANARWQAAFELSKVLHAGQDKALADPAFAQELMRTFEEARADDPLVRRYLALALGRLGNRAAVPALLDLLADHGAVSAADAETRIYAMWSLGALGDPAAVPALVQLAADDDAGLRKGAVHALGAFTDDASTEALRRALDDAAADVRWNAAIALARRGDERARPLLVQMLDRAEIGGVEGLQPEQAREVLLQAIAAAAALRDASMDAALVALRDGDADLSVRDAARKALEGKTP